MPPRLCQLRVWHELPVPVAGVRREDKDERGVRQGQHVRPGVRGASVGRRLRDGRRRGRTRLFNKKPTLFNRARRGYQDMRRELHVQRAAKRPVPDTRVTA